MERQMLVRNAVAEQRQEFARSLERLERAIREMAREYGGETSEVLYVIRPGPVGKKRSAQCLVSAADY